MSEARLRSHRSKYSPFTFVVASLPRVCREPYLEALTRHRMRPRGKGIFARAIFLFLQDGTHDV